MFALAIILFGAGIFCLMISRLFKNRRNWRLAFLFAGSLLTGLPFLLAGYYLWLLLTL